MIVFLLTVLAYSTQNEALFSGSVPEKVSTFQVTLRGSDPFYAGVRVNGKWVDDPSMDISPRQEVELVPDAPWQTQDTYRILRSKVELKYEASAMRRDRLQKTLAAQGYSVRETANGWRAVRDSDAQYAERMRKMLTLSRQPAPETVSEAASRVPVRDDAAATTARRRLLFVMLAIPVFCLAAIAWVAVKMVFGDGNRQKA